MAELSPSVWPLACFFLALQLCAGAHAQNRGCPTNTPNDTFASAPLPLPYDGYMPAIDNETMFLHFTRHYGGAINNVNGILARYPALLGLPLATIVEQVGLTAFATKYKLPPNETLSLRNNAGSMFNHAIFWRIMTTYNTSTPADLNTELSLKINSTFGSVNSMLDSLRTTANSVFGSGWAWLVYYTRNQTIKIVSTPNQDNPLMRGIVRDANRGVPLIGIDVWEHAYYLKYRNVRSSYTAQWMNMIDWNIVKRNYLLAKDGKYDSLYC